MGLEVCDVSLSLACIFSCCILVRLSVSSRFWLGLVCGPLLVVLES